MSAMHTYTVHVTVLAKSDQQAWETAYRLAGDRAVVSVTDADDWAEHVTDCLCPACGKPVDRERVGSSHRIHHACSVMAPYPIQDTNPFALVPVEA